MATPKTVLTYPLNGSQKDFPIPFEYLARKFVQVTLIGVDRKLLVLNTDYRFSTRTTITTTIAWGAAQGYNLIEIRRYTSASERLVDFSDGSILRAYDLNTAQVQSLHIAEEGRDIATDTIGVDNNGQLDARGRRIVNLADAVADSDAVTLRQEKAWGDSALNQANRAQSQADIATSQAAISTQQAGASQTARLGSESARDLALQYRNTAEAHKNAAATSAQNSEDSYVLSRAWAAEPENSEVSPGLYSSFHYSRKASASSSTATSAASTSVASAASAKDEADRAEGYANGLNLPSATGNAGKVLRQKSDVSGLEYVKGIDTIRADILGTVSMASGVPSGGIINRGSNANGSYVLWADGTAKCTVKKTYIQAMGSALGALYWKGTSDWPSLPLPINLTSVDDWSCFGGGEYPLLIGTVTPPDTASFGIFRAYSPITLPLATYTVTYTVWGRWD